MRKYTLNRTALYLMSAALLIVSAAATLLARKYLASFQIFMYSLIGLFWTAAVLVGIVLLPLFFKRTVICISSAEITVHTGLFFLRRDYMKMSAVQYVTRISLPLSGITGFNFIVIRALGGSLLLPFLNVSDCEEILAALCLEIQRRS